MGVRGVRGVRVVGVLAAAEIICMDIIYIVDCIGIGLCVI